MFNARQTLWQLYWFVPKLAAFFFVLESKVFFVKGDTEVDIIVTVKSGLVANSCDGLESFCKECRNKSPTTLARYREALEAVPR